MQPVESIASQVLGIITQTQKDKPVEKEQEAYKWWLSVLRVVDECVNPLSRYNTTLPQASGHLFVAKGHCYAILNSGSNYFQII